MEIKQSFGIYVAKLAGIPDAVGSRAKEILSGLESKKKEIKFKSNEPSLFDSLEILPAKTLSPNEEKALAILKKLDPERTPPIEALSILDELTKLLK